VAETQVEGALFNTAVLIVIFISPGAVCLSCSVQLTRECGLVLSWLFWHCQKKKLPGADPSDISTPPRDLLSYIADLACLFISWLDLS